MESTNQPVRDRMQFGHLPMQIKEFYTAHAFQPLHWLQHTRVATYLPILQLQGQAIVELTNGIVDAAWLQDNVV